MRHVGRSPAPIRDESFGVQPCGYRLRHGLVGDGQFREAGLGGVVRDCGLRLNASHLNASDQSLEGAREVHADDVDRVRYGVTGLPRRFGTSRAQQSSASPAWRSWQPSDSSPTGIGPVDSPAFEPWSEEFHPPARTRCSRPKDGLQSWLTTSGMRSDPSLRPATRWGLAEGTSRDGDLPGRRPAPPHASPMLEVAFPGCGLHREHRGVAGQRYSRARRRGDIGVGLDAWTLC